MYPTDNVPTATRRGSPSHAFRPVTPPNNSAARYRFGKRAIGALAVLGGSVLVSCALFWQVVFLHRILIPADILYFHDPLWKGLAPPGFARPANPLDSDALTEFYPWTVLGWQTLHDHVLPLWNPYSFAGTPFMASMQAAIFYPVNLLLYPVLAPPVILGARAVIHLVITLCGTYLVARRLGQPATAAVLSALAFGLSLPVVVWLEHPMAGATAWLPWMLLATDLLIIGPRVVGFLGVAFFVALDILSGHGESTAHILLFCSGFALFRLLTLSELNLSRARLAAFSIVAAAFGCALAAVHLLPVVFQLPISEAAVDRTIQFQAMPISVFGDPTRWSTLMTAVVPDFFGNPTWRTVLPHIDSYNETALYIGIVPVVLAIFAARHRRDPLILFFAVASVVCIGVALDAPILGLFNGLPLLRVANNGRLRIEYAFAMAMLAGYGLDALRTSDHVPRIRRWTFGMLGLVTIVAIVGVASLALTPGLSLSVAWQAATPIIWLLLFGVLLALYRRQLITYIAFAVLVVVVSGSELFVLTQGYHTTVAASELKAVPPAITVVQNDHSLYRVTGLGSALLPALSTIYGLQDIRGYDPAFDATYEQFFSPSLNAPKGMRLSMAAFGPSPKGARALNLLNVKYIFAACSVPMNPVYYRRIYKGAGCIYQNLSVLPRFWVVHSVQFATLDNATKLLGAGAVDLRKTAVLDASNPDHGAWKSLQGSIKVATPSALIDKVQNVHYELNMASATVHASSPGALIFSDAYAPGWSATVDGQAVPLVRADAIIRAIPIRKGTHTVRFTYVPTAFALGAFISALAIGMWLGVVVIVLGRYQRLGKSGKYSRVAYSR